MNVKLSTYADNRCWWFLYEILKNANSVDFKLWGSGASAGEVQQTKLNVSSQSKGNELDCL